MAIWNELPFLLIINFHSTIRFFITATAYTITVLRMARKAQLAFGLFVQELISLDFNVYENMILQTLGFMIASKILKLLLKF